MYHIRVTCRACTGVDDQGCFAGPHGWVIRIDSSYEVDDGSTAPEDRAAFRTYTHAMVVAEEIAADSDWFDVWRAEVVKV